VREFVVMGDRKRMRNLHDELKNKLNHLRLDNATPNSLIALSLHVLEDIQ